MRIISHYDEHILPLYFPANGYPNNLMIIAVP